MKHAQKALTRKVANSNALSLSLKPNKHSFCIKSGCWDTVTSKMQTIWDTGTLKL